MLLEAMASGKPIVASDIEGYAGIVSHEKEGLLFPPKDSAALGNALELLIKDPGLARRMGAQGRETVENYRWEAVARQVENYYLDCQKAVNGRSRPRTG